MPRVRRFSRILCKFPQCCTVSLCIIHYRLRCTHILASSQRLLMPQISLPLVSCHGEPVMDCYPDASILSWFFQNKSQVSLWLLWRIRDMLRILVQDRAGALSLGGRPTCHTRTGSRACACGTGCSTGSAENSRAHLRSASETGLRAIYGARNATYSSSIEAHPQAILPGVLSPFHKLLGIEPRSAIYHIRNAFCQPIFPRIP
jgi:hypothetical protein